MGSGLWIPDLRLESFHLDPDHPLSKGNRLFLGGNLPGSRTALDSSPFGNDATLVDFAFPATLTSGWKATDRYGLNFDDTNDTITFSRSIVDTALPHSFAWKFKTRQESGYDILWNKGTFESTSTIYQHYGNRPIYFFGGAYLYWPDVLAIADGLCSFAATYDGTTLRLYRNGKLGDSAARTGANANVIPTIGASSGYTLNGSSRTLLCTNAACQRAKSNCLPALIRPMSNLDRAGHSGDGSVSFGGIGTSYVDTGTASADGTVSAVDLLTGVDTGTAVVDGDSQRR